MSDRPTDRPDDAHKAHGRAAHEEDDLDDVDDRDDPYADDLVDEIKDGGRERGFATKVIGDLAKRALMTGIGAVFMSEESLKHQLSDMKLPKEAMNYVVGQADRTKKEIVGAIARETRDFLSKLEMDKVLARVLAGTTIEIQTRIKILPKEGGGIQTSVEENKTSIARAEASSTEGAPEDDDDRPRKRSKRRRDET
jgi:hypothetical protein